MEGETCAPVWQPVMLITPRRVECACGAKAIFVLLEGDLERPDYTGWCQDCWAREQEAIEHGDR